MHASVYFQLASGLEACATEIAQLLLVGRMLRAVHFQCDRCCVESVADVALKAFFNAPAGCFGFHAVK